MGRLTEAVYMANCSPTDWIKYSKSQNKTSLDSGRPFYLHHVSRSEAKRLRELKKKNKQL